MHKLGISHMNKREDRVVFHTMGLTKSSQPFKPNQPIVFKSNESDPLLCPVKYMSSSLIKRVEIIGNDVKKFSLLIAKLIIKLNAKMKKPK